MVSHTSPIRSTPSRRHLSRHDSVWRALFLLIPVDTWTGSCLAPDVSIKLNYQSHYIQVCRPYTDVGIAVNPPMTKPILTIAFIMAAMCCYMA